LYGARGEPIGYLLAEGGAAAGPGSERGLLDRLLRAGLIAAGISGALALALAFLFSSRLLKPVEALKRAAARLAGGDLSQRVSERGNDELAMLGRAFNHMATSLQRAVQNRRAMTADIAHELRTPIAVQRAHLEALQDGVYPLTIENLQPVLEQTELLTRLVEDLRTLALADAGELRLERSLTPLPGLVQRVVDRFRPEAENRHIQLTLEEQPERGPMDSFVDAGRIEQILNNLLSNALRYTPEDGEVRVELRCRDGWVELRVADNGEGIPPEALPRLFERFFRADPSRTRAAGGSGLGLAIARQLALAHGGDLSAANQPQGGAVLILRLPLQDSEPRL
jgi:signal transduction histidine kinase